VIELAVVDEEKGDLDWWGAGSRRLNPNLGPDKFDAVEKLRRPVEWAPFFGNLERLWLD
jgi:hypothetical protein